MFTKSLARLTRSICPRNAAVPRQRLATGCAEPAAEDDAPGLASWFESSYDLSRGIEIAELDWCDMTPPADWLRGLPALAGALQ